MKGGGAEEKGQHDAALETKDCCQIGLGQAAGSRRKQGLGSWLMHDLM